MTMNKKDFDKRVDLFVYLVKMEPPMTVPAAKDDFKQYTGIPSSEVSEVFVAVMNSGRLILNEETRKLEVSPDERTSKRTR